jgi:hypothetical protein
LQPCNQVSQQVIETCGKSAGVLLQPLIMYAPAFRTSARKQWQHTSQKPTLRDGGRPSEFSDVFKSAS